MKWTCWKAPGHYQHWKPFNCNRESEWVTVIRIWEIFSIFPWITQKWINAQQKRFTITPQKWYRDLPQILYTHLYNVLSPIDFRHGWEIFGLLSDNKANLRDLIAATGLVILLKVDSNYRFLRPVWPWNLMDDGRGWGSEVLSHQ